MKGGFAPFSFASSECERRTVLFDEIADQHDLLRPKARERLSEPPGRPGVSSWQGKGTAISDSLWASVEAAGPLGILGAEAFEQAINELFRLSLTKDLNRKTGMLFTEINGAMRFLFRDPESRAWYVFQSIMGLTYPCQKDGLSRRSLRQGFLEGWKSGSLCFLAEVQFEDIDLYKMRMSH